MVVKKDEIVVPGFYAYLLRVDYVNHTQDEIIKMLENFIEKEEIEAFHMFEERGKITGKLHIQAIVWSQKRYTATMAQSCKRDYFKPIYEHSSTSIAFRDAKSPQNLASYSQKDMEMIMSSLSPEEVARIPIWKNIKSYKDREFKKTLITWLKNNIHLPLDEYMIQLTQLHWDNHRAQPARQTMKKYLGIYHPDYTARDHVESLNILPHNYQPYQPSTVPSYADEMEDLAESMSNV